MALATLSIDLIAKLASLEAGLDKAARINQKTAADIESRWTRVGGTLRTVGGLVGGAFATQQLAGFIDRTIDGLDKLNDVADSTGSSVEKISALEDIGARTGTGIDAIEGSLVKFNAALKEADGKNGVSQALKAIGVDVERLKQLDPAEALLETATALAGYQDEGRRARIVQDLFGKSVREVGPFLKDLAEAGQLNATVTKQQAAEAEKFNKQIFALQKNISDAARSLVSDLLPALNDYFDRLNKNGGFSGSIAARLGLDEQGQLESKAATLRAEITRTGDTIARFGEELSRDPDNERLTIRLEKARLRLADLQRQAAATSEKLKGVADQLDPTRGRRPRNEGGGGYNPPQIKEPGSAGDTKVSEAQRYLENLQKQLEKTRDLNVYEQALADIQNKRIDGITPKLQAEILAKAKLVDLAGKTLAVESRQTAFRQAELQAQEAVNKAMVSSQESVSDRARTVNELLEATPSKRLEVTRLEMQRLADAFLAGKLSAEQYTEVVHTALGITEDAGEEVTAFSQQAAANIQDALGASTLSILEGNFKSIGDLFENMVNRMVSEAVAADLAKRLLGEGYGKSTNKIGGLVGQGFDYLKGAFGGAGSAGTSGNNPSAYTAGGGGGGFGGAIGSFLTLFSGFFADGGRIPPGKFGAVGEEGLELAYGGSTGLNIVPLGKGGQGGGRTQQINYAPTFVLQAPASRETQEQVAAMAFGGAQEAWSRQS